MADSMQTFLPYESFVESARALDYRRLGKQRVEAWQIIQCLVFNKRGWRFHPAVRMWECNPATLCWYGINCSIEWIDRGYEDNLLPMFIEALKILPPDYGFPEWLGDPAFHASHRSNLLRKDPIHYGRFGWTEPADLEYVWPLPTAREERRYELAVLRFLAARRSAMGGEVP